MPRMLFTEFGEHGEDKGETSDYNLPSEVGGGGGGTLPPSAQIDLRRVFLAHCCDMRVYVSGDSRADLNHLSQ